MVRLASRSATHALTHADFVLASPTGRRRLAVVLLMLAAVAAGALGSTLWWRAQPVDRRALQALTAQQHALQQQLDQARLALRVSQGQAQALERGIDTLNKQLGECQEQLTFFRKAREPQSPH
jgi:uncharacterized protein HemX